MTPASNNPTISDGGRPSPPPPPARRPDTTATLPGGSASLSASPTKATVGGPAAPDLSANAFATLGHYTILQQIARGGMGTVMKAYHPGLDRTYALKVIQVDPISPSIAAERFLREARAVAKVGKHPNIVAVHDAGQEGSYYYLAMDFVEGDALDALLRGQALPGRRAAEIAVGVAEGLAVAHAAGIIHRDLKPSNILFTKEGVPQVSDFGLARDVSARERLSQDGQILGTLQYMAPEQATGEQERIGPATDVYGLGATLYEMITGRPPFEGPTQFAIWSLVMDGDPVPPRKVNPRVHPDLETICLKSIARAPERRYASMREMAADLRNFLNGEPIAARRASLGARLLRKSIRRWPVVLPSAAAVLLGLGLGGYALLSRMRTSREVAIELGIGAQLRQSNQPRAARDAYQRAHALDRANPEARAGLAWADAEVARLDAASENARKAALAAEAAAKELVRKSGLVQNVLARWASLAPTVRQLERSAYDSRKTPAERQSAGDALWPKVRVFMERTPKDPTSQATMKAFAGWARFLAGHGDEGLGWMREAAQDDPDLPYGPMMEALCCMAQYLARQPLPAISTSPTGVRFGPMPKEPDEIYLLRGEMDRLLSQAASAKVWGEGIAQDFRRAIAALQAMQAGRCDETEQALTEVLGTAAMTVFETDVVFARAKVRYLLKRFDDGVADMRQVVEDRPEAAEARLYLGQTLFGVAVSSAAKGIDPRPAYEEAIRAYTEALDRCPGWIDPMTMRGVAWLWKGDAEWNHGADPLASYDRSIADFDDAIRRANAEPSVHVNRGNALMAKAKVEAARGEDARSTLGRAIESYDKAVSLDPGRPDSHVCRGGAFAVLGDQEMSRGVDPSKSLDKAIADFDEALRLDPESVAAYLNRGHTTERMGCYVAARGGDAREQFAKAILDAGEAIRRDPTLTQAFVNRGCAYLGKGDAESAHGVDPMSSFDHAIEDLDVALQCDPSNVQAYNNRGVAWKDKGEILVTLRKDPADAFDHAIADLTQVIDRNPNMTQGYNNRGIVWTNKARMEKDAGEDPTASLEKAVADYDHALKINPKGWMACSNRGLALEQLGRYDEAVAAFEAALQLVGGNYPKLREWRDRAKEEGIHQTHEEHK